MVEESAVQAGQDGDVTFVRLGVQTIQQRELKKGEGTDGVVEGRGEGEVEVVVVFVGGGVQEVKIANNHPGDGVERSEHLELS